MRKAVGFLGRGDNLPEGVGYTLKRRLLGPPMVNEELSEQRLKDPGARGTSPLVRVGNGWLEVKWIPRKSGKLSGPYLYF